VKAQRALIDSERKSIERGHLEKGVDALDGIAIGPVIFGEESRDQKTQQERVASEAHRFLKSRLSCR
jgi:hypothetical protein